MSCSVPSNTGVPAAMADAAWAHTWGHVARHRSAYEWTCGRACGLRPGRALFDTAPVVDLLCMAKKKGQPHWEGCIRRLQAYWQAYTARHKLGAPVPVRKVCEFSSNHFEKNLSWQTESLNAKWQSRLGRPHPLSKSPGNFTSLLISTSLHIVSPLFRRQPHHVDRKLQG